MVRSHLVLALLIGVSVLFALDCRVPDVNAEGHVCPCPDGWTCIPETQRCTRCAAGTGDCDGNRDNGCETNTSENAEHCGLCGRSCFGAACTASRCAAIPFVTGLPGALRAIVLDANAICWGAQGSVGCADRAEGGVAASLATPAEPWQIAIDEAFVYYPDQGGVKRVARAGGVPETIWPAPVYPRGVAVDGDNVYATDYIAGGSVVAIEKQSLTVTPIAPGQNYPRAVATDEKDVFWVNVGQQGKKNGAVARWTKGSPQPVTLFYGAEYPDGPALDDQFVYFAEGAEVKRIAKSSGGALAPESVGTAPSPIGSLAVDATHVYVYASKLIKIDKATGFISEYQELGGDGSAVAVDDEFVYFAAGNQIQRVAK